MAMVSLSSPMPLNRRIAPMANSAVRYSDVAHYVGLQLLHDPKLAQSRHKFKKTEVTSRYLEDESESSDILSTSSSLPNVHDRAELLRSKLRQLKADQRSEKEYLKRLEHSLSDTKDAEQKAHVRASHYREQREQHQDQMKQVGERIKHLTREDRISRLSLQGHSQSSASSRQPSRAGTKEQKGRNITSRSTATPSGIGSKPRTESCSASLFSLDSVENPKPKVKELTLEMLEGFNSEAELINHQKEAVRAYIVENVGNPMQAFKRINGNGSGRISSMEFADGIDRLGVPWKALTGLNKASDFFRLFAPKNKGVITFRDFFPDYEEPKTETGYDTPTFWEEYEKEDFVAGHADSDVPKWHSSCSDDGLKVLYEKEHMDFEAAFTRKWMTTTWRRMKGKGKSDARTREMVALHLPRGTGTLDLHGVPTINEHDVKAMRQKYFDQMKGPQRRTQQYIYDLHASRRDLSAAKQSFYHVVSEPVLQRKMMEEQAKQAKEGLLGGLSLLGGHKQAAPEEKEDVASLASDMQGFLHDAFEHEKEDL